MDRRTNRSWISGAVLGAVLAVAPAWAGDITVTSGADAGTGTLRQAIADAQPGDRILFDGTFAEVKLTTDSLFIPKSLNIAGPGASRLRIVRGAAAPPFGIFILDAQATTPLSVTFSGLTITGGADEYFGGGGISAGGPGVHLTVRDCDVVGNWSVAGGGIAVGGSTDGVLEMRNTTVAGNSSSMGGGIYVAFARADISGSTISGNVGGGITAETSILAVHTSTISNNQGPSGTAVRAFGESTVRFDATTVAGNPGTAVWVEGTYSGAKNLSYRNSIFQAAPGGQSITTAYAVSLGHNLFSDHPEAALDSDLTGQDARLGPLAFNGGPTRTYALLPGSPAIDTGNCADSAGQAMASDQRGSARPAQQCDMGAFEVADGHGAVLDAVASLGTKLESAVAPLASQQSLNKIGDRLDAVDFSALARQASVDGVRAVVDQENVLLSARLDDKVSSRASQASVDTRASQASVDVWRVDEGRLAIERQLSLGTPLVSFFLPAASGGRIESVRQVLSEWIDRSVGAGVDLRQARLLLERGDTSLADRKYVAAWNAYAEAYRALTRTKKER